MRLAVLIRCLMIALAGLMLAIPQAHAQQCIGMSEGPRDKRIVPVKMEPASEHGAFRIAQAGREVKITFVGHATFLIESPKGVKIVTDYNDYVRPSVVPDVITMNIAHDTHYTNFPNPAIKHILRGWNPAGGPIEHNLNLEDVHVRNIPTNIREWTGGTREYGNSIFVFEIAGMCIAHLGHLHHTLTVQQLGQIGQMDVLLVPVDGGYTLDLDGMVEVLKTLKAPLMIPMHYFSRYGLERFLRRVGNDFDVVENQVASITVSRQTLPTKQQIMVLPGR